MTTATEQVGETGAARNLRDLKAALRRGLAHHQAGDWRQALTAYQEVLVLDPNQPDALNLVGALALQRGDHSLAVTLLRRAVSLDPRAADFAINLGLALQAAGQTDEARASFERAVLLRPASAQAQLHLGNARRLAGDLIGAIQAFDRALALDGELAEAHATKGATLHALAGWARPSGPSAALERRPGFAEAHCDLGSVLQAAGRLDEAIDAYEQAIQLKPDLVDAYSNLGTALVSRGATDRAVSLYRKALALKPAYFEALINLGMALGDLDTALVCYTEVLRLDAKSATAHFNLGNVKKKQGDLIGALHAYHQAGQLLPLSPEVELNIGTTLREVGQLGAATMALERAASLNPEWAEPRVNLALTELSQGDLARGWENYEWRWAQIGLTPERGYPWPVWRGESLDGRSILVWREQGLGDELLFATCIPDLVQAGARVTLTVDGQLVSPLGRAFPDVKVIQDQAPRDQTFDFHTPVGSLPRYLRPDRASFKPQWSWLVPDRAQLNRWRDRMAALPPDPRVGICWRSGLMTHDRRRYYSQLAEWRPLFELPTSSGSTSNTTSARTSCSRPRPSSGFGSTAGPRST